MQITLKELVQYEIQTEEKSSIFFSTDSEKVYIWDYDVNFPWEYEKFWILLEVKEHKNTLFYHFFVEWKHIAIIPTDEMELSEEMLSFFWDIDILFIKWNKNSVKIFDNIEAKVVIPYGEEKSQFFLNTNSKPEPTKTYKVPKELDWENTDFVEII